MPYRSILYEYTLKCTYSLCFYFSNVKLVFLNFRKEYKLFIGGTFKRSDNGTIKYDENVFIPSAVESDVHNAVSSAMAAQPKYNNFQLY